MTDVLLVGAPMYMSEEKFETGRVYIFSITKVRPFLLLVFFFFAYSHVWYFSFYSHLPYIHNNIRYDL